MRGANGCTRSGLVTRPIPRGISSERSRALGCSKSRRGRLGDLCSRALRFGPERISLEELLMRNALGLGGAIAHGKTALPE